MVLAMLSRSRWQHDAATHTHTCSLVADLELLNHRVLIELGEVLLACHESCCERRLHAHSIATARRVSGPRDLFNEIK